MIRATALLCTISAVAGFAGRAGHGHRQLQNEVDVLKMSTHAEVLADQADGIVSQPRRALLLSTIALPTIWTAHSPPSVAAKLRPDDAYASLVKARSELQYAKQTYLPKKDWDGLRTYLNTEAANMNNYEASAQALLESKRLDAESKKDIGTIRRYGVGADVIIMYGGLKGELEEEEDDDGETKAVNYAGVEKYLRRTAESLDEVLAICRSNGFA